MKTTRYWVEEFLPSGRWEKHLFSETYVPEEAQAYLDHFVKGAALDWIKGKMRICSCEVTIVAEAEG